MTDVIIDRETLKSVLKEIFNKEPEILKSALTELLDEKIAEFENLDIEQKRKIEESVKNDFERYANVFKALAKGPQ